MGKLVLDLPSTQVTIDGEVYTLTALDAVTARPLVARLMKALAAGTQSFEGTEDSLIKVFGRIVQDLPVDLFEDLCTTFSSRCQVRKEGKDMDLDTVFQWHFARRYAHMMKWLAECIKFNFTDFLDEIMRRLGTLQRASKSESQTT